MPRSHSRRRSARRSGLAERHSDSGLARFGCGAITAAAACIALVVVAMADLGLPWQQRAVPPVPPAVRRLLAQPAPDAVAAAFTNARSHKDRLRWIRNPDRLEPVLRRFYQTGAGSTEEFLRYSPLPASLRGDAALAQFDAIMRNGEHRLLFVVDTPEGPRVDFETYARHCDTTWEDLLAGRVLESGAMRVLLKPDNFFNRQFPDDGRWFSIAAESPDLQDMLHLYAPVTLPRVPTFARQSAGHPLRATVRLASRNGSHFHREFQITELVAEDWVVP